MNILKKKNSSNLLYPSQHFFKDLNLNKKFKKANQILGKDPLLLNMDTFTLLNLYQKENFLIPNLNPTNILKKNLVYFIKQRYDNGLLLESNKINHTLMSLYIYFLIKKYNKKIKHKSVKGRTVKKKTYNKNIVHQFIRGRIVKKKKKHILVAVFGLLVYMNKRQLHKNRKYLYNNYKFKKLFLFYKARSLKFTIINFKIDQNKSDMIFSRKHYVEHIKKNMKK